MMYHTPISERRGFALLIAVIFTSVVLAVGMALLDIAYKQVLLASAAKSSQYAFYNADSGLECALYWDQKSDAFDYSSPLFSGSLSCNGVAISNYSSAASGGTRVTTFSIPCPTGSTADVSIYKKNTGSTDIYANGFSTCDASVPTRIERGIRAHY